MTSTLTSYFPLQKWALSGAQPQVRLAPSYLTMAGGFLMAGDTPKSSKSLPSGYVKIAIENGHL